MASEIHALVQNTHDLDAVSGNSVEQDVRPGPQFSIPRPDVIASCTALRFRCGGLDAGLDPTDIGCRLLGTPVPGGAERPSRARCVARYQRDAIRSGPGGRLSTGA